MIKLQHSMVHATPAAHRRVDNGPYIWDRLWGVVTLGLPKGDDIAPASRASRAEIRSGDGLNDDGPKLERPVSTVVGRAVDRAVNRAFAGDVGGRDRDPAPARASIPPRESAVRGI